MLWIILIVAIPILVLLMMYVQSYRYRLKYYNLYFSELPSEFDGIKILFISDVHRRRISKKLLQNVKHDVDYIFIGGDLVEHGVPIDQVQDNIKLITSFGSTYFVWGNHDLTYNRELLESLLVANGVTILENQSILLRNEKGRRLWLVGVGDVCTKQDRLDHAIQATLEEDGFKILLAHVPTITRKITPEHKIALVLSGHTHAGQIALPWIGPITGAVGQLFPKQVVGHHYIKNTQLFISSGYGTSHFPLRSFTTPEVVIFTLKTK